MSKSMEQVLMENYPDFDPLWVNLVEDKGDGVYFKRQNWPAEWGEAPTDEQLETWMSE
tara:strand:- start:4612 stop:4785 length:174 start_codon:yes stop_codon:yes gene_type:complete